MRCTTTFSMSWLLYHLVLLDPVLELSRALDEGVGYVLSLKSTFNPSSDLQTRSTPVLQLSSSSRTALPEPMIITPRS